MTKKNPLGCDDWIKAGFRALSSSGPQAIKVEAIARDLKVSKGSFYWHFKNAPALKSAMLEHWTKVATLDVIAGLSATKASPPEKLKQIVKLATGTRANEYGGLLVEGAIRSWARNDKEVATALAKVEKARLQFLEKVFIETGASADDSATKARLLYGGLIGTEHLSVQGHDGLQADLQTLLELLLPQADAPYEDQTRLEI